MRQVIFDLKTDGLLDTVSVIWVICLRIIEDGVSSPIFEYVGDEIDDAVSIIEDADMVIGHNILGYDLKVLEKLYLDFCPKEGQIIRDTFVLSQMVFADEKDRDYRRFERGEIEGKLIGLHTLEGWGQRLGFPKGDYAKIMKERGLDPWKQFDFELGVPYCVQDVEITTLLWKKIEARNWEPESIRLEHQIAYLMDLQQESGFQFDVEAAQLLEVEVRAEYDKLSEEAKAHFGTWITADKWSKHPSPRAEFGEDESRRAWAEVVVPKRDVKYKDPMKGSRWQDAPYCPVQVKEFNPNSRPMIIDRLTKIYEWEPVDFTEKGNTEVNDEVLRALADKWPICEILAELFFLNKLLGALSDGENGWLKVVGSDGRIHGRVIVGGTRSGRASHASPNVAQVKKVAVADVKLKDGSFSKKVLGPDGNPRPECFKEDGTLKKSVILKGRLGEYGWECRSLFTAPNFREVDGWWLMGCDLKGVELRCFAHHLAEFDNGEYAREVLNGDIHTKNQLAAGLATRDQSKTFIYACVTMDTYALTSEGWKTYHQVNVGDLVMTYNASLNIKEWKPVLEKVYYEDAEVVSIDAQTFKIKATPNHRWFVRESRERGDYQRPYLQEKVLTTDELNERTHIITNAPLRDERGLPAYVIDDFNKKPKRETCWVNEVIGMSKNELDAFLAGFMIADGYYQDKSVNSGGWNWNQNTGNLQEAALLASYLSHYGYLNVSTRTDSPSEMKVVHLNSKSHAPMTRMSKTTLPNQPVWCVRTENESWAIRQGDTITITGNTLYGGGDSKIGSIVCAPNTSESIMKARGKDLKRKFQQSVPAFGKLLQKIGKQYRKNKQLIGLDGRILYIKSQHSALNLQLQSDGALLAKKWVCIFFEDMINEGYVYNEDFFLCAWVHDEIQVACRTKDLALRAGKIAEAAALKAGESFGYRVPIEADSKIGRTWASTH